MRERENKENTTYLLPKAWLNILSFGSVDEGGVFVVEAVQTVGLLVDKGVVLRDELPANFGGNNRRLRGTVGGNRCRHDGDWPWLSSAKSRKYMQNLLGKQIRKMGRRKGKQRREWRR